jgi:hypothetical protein
MRRWFGHKTAQLQRDLKLIVSSSYSCLTNELFSLPPKPWFQFSSQASRCSRPPYSYVPAMHMHLTPFLYPIALILLLIYALIQCPISSPHHQQCNLFNDLNCTPNRLTGNSSNIGRRHSVPVSDLNLLPLLASATVKKEATPLQKNNAEDLGTLCSGLLHLPNVHTNISD